MLLGARQFFERRGKSAPTARDYVQNGLIAMWDGIENAGWGVHSADSIVTDLISGTVANVPANSVIGANYVESPANGRFTLLNDLQVGSATEFTLESVGTCMTQPTITNNTSGSLVVDGIGGLYMWRRYYAGACGVVGAIVFHSNDMRIYYIGSPSNVSTANAEADAESFGVLRHRACTFGTVAASLQAQYQSYTFYYNGLAKAGYNTMSYSDAYTQGAHVVRSPDASSCSIRWTSIRIYARKLSAAEIEANYAIDKARFNLP